MMIGDPPPDTRRYLTSTIPLLGFDVETTGADKGKSGIVQLGMAVNIPGRPRQRTGMIVNCPEEIEDGAAGVHGISEERKRAEGVPVEEMADKLHQAFEWAVKHRVPVVAFNAQFDWTVLQSTAKRHGLTHIENYELKGLPIFDPLVVSRTLDRYRKGGHKLETLLPEALAEDFVEGEPHEASFDAEAATVVARRQLRLHAPAFKGLALDGLTEQMRRWHQEWADNFEAWLRSNRDPEAVLFKEWPFSHEEYRMAIGDENPPFEPTGKAQ